MALGWPKRPHASKPTKPGTELPLLQSVGPKSTIRDIHCIACQVDESGAATALNHQPKTPPEVFRLIVLRAVKEPYLRSTQQRLCSA